MQAILLMGESSNRSKDRLFLLRHHTYRPRQSLPLLLPTLLHAPLATTDAPNMRLLIQVPYRLHRGNHHRYAQDFHQGVSNVASMICAVFAAWVNAMMPSAAAKPAKTKQKRW